MRKREEAPDGATRSVYIAPYGDVPLIPVTWRTPAGETRTYHTFDPSYEPPLPAGAVRADISRQLGSALGLPRYYYVDQAKECVECGAPFTFSAKEQKHWYETLKFYYHSQATRCLACRRKQRSGVGLERELMQARAASKKHAGDPGVLLSLAEAIVRYHRHFERGPLAEAIALTRRASRLFTAESRGTAASDALFWEAACHARAGRSARARELFQRFLSAPRAGKRQAALAREASAWLAAEG